MKINFKSLKERLTNLNKKGLADAMKIPMMLLGLYIIVQFLVVLLPDLINNLTGISIGGSFGGLFTTILPLLVIFGIFMWVANHMGLKTGTGGMK